MVSLFETFHRAIVRRHGTITTYPYLDQGFKTVRFGFISLFEQSKISLPVIERNKSSDQTRLLFVGRLTEAKGIFTLLDALSIIVEKGQNIHLSIAGDGYLADTVKEYSKHLKLHNRVTFHGHCCWEDLQQMYYDADLFVLPSYAEGMPKVVLEAMTLGVPVVTTAVGSLPLLFQARQHCRFVPVADSGRLADVICESILNPTETRMMAEKAYVLARQYTLKGTTASLANDIKEFYCGTI